MANTREVLGDQETLDGLVTNTLESFEEDGIYVIKDGVMQRKTALQTVKFPILTNTGTSTFQNCTGLTQLTEDSFSALKTVGSSAFANCTGLTEVKLPSVTSVGNNAFSGCTNLEIFETGINTVAFTTPFTSCSKLKSLIINSTQMSTLNSNTGLNGTAIANYQGAVYVPDDLVDIYKANNNWKNYFIVSKQEYPLNEYPEQGDYYNSNTIDDWTEIIQNNNYANDYQLGKTVPINFGSYGIHQMELVAMDVDIRSDGDISKNNGKARMTWICKDCLTTNMINSNNATIWRDSYLRSWLRNTVLFRLPRILRENIVEVNKTSLNGSSTIISTETLWIPSIREMFGVPINNCQIEDSGIDYTNKFANNNSRIKTNSYWWLRSSDSRSSGRYALIDSQGTISLSYGNPSSYGVVPCFCI